MLIHMHGNSHCVKLNYRDYTYVDDELGRRILQRAEFTCCRKAQFQNEVNRGRYGAKIHVMLYPVGLWCMLTKLQRLNSLCK